MTVVQADVHHVVEDHEEADVVGEEEDVDDDARDDTKGHLVSGHLVSLSEEREDMEDNRHHQQQDVEDDVGIDEVLPVLPDPVDGKAEEDEPDEGHDEGQDVDGHEVRRGIIETPEYSCRVYVGLVWNPREFSQALPDLVCLLGQFITSLEVLELVAVLNDLLEVVPALQLLPREVEALGEVSVVSGVNEQLQQTGAKRCQGDQSRHGEDEDEAGDELQGEEQLADNLDDAFHSAEAAGSVPLEKDAVDDERNEKDEDHDPAGEYPDELFGDDRRDDGHEDASQNGEDADDEPDPAEERDGHGDSQSYIRHTYAAVLLQSELVQHFRFPFKSARNVGEIETRCINFLYHRENQNSVSSYSGLDIRTILS